MATESLMKISSRLIPSSLIFLGVYTHHLHSFDGPTRQVLRYVSDRTGIVSFANFPFIWLFGMRNNVAMWLTGWDFGTYNNFHRWCARVATLEAVVHSILYTVLIFMSELMQHPFYIRLTCISEY